MNYKEVKKQLSQHRKLIGKKVDDQNISHLIVVPADGTSQTDIFWNTYNGVDTFKYLQDHSDFKIVVAFDMEDFGINGTTPVQDLEIFLKKHPHLK